MKIDKALQDLIQISRTVGKDPRLVQGGGGNTSVKTEDGRRMYIKASGTALKDMSEKSGWRRMDVGRILEILNGESLGDMSDQDRETQVVTRLGLSCDDGLCTNSRPSVEAHMHAILSRCVVHLHPVAVCSFTSSKGGRKILDELFADEENPPVWIPYTDPGYSLGAEVLRQVGKHQKKYGRLPNILLLAKHGLFVAADSRDEVLGLVDRVIGKCSKRLGKPAAAKFSKPDPKEIADAKLAIRGAVYNASGEYVKVLHYMDEEVAGFMKRKDAPKLAGLPSLTPDELIYGHGGPLWADKPDAAGITEGIRSAAAKGEPTPVAFMVKGLGLFVTGTESTIPTIRDIVTSFLAIRSAAEDNGGVIPLNQRERDFIRNWEAESFRMKVLSGEAAGELVGRVAVVTGAGSGLGRSIAVGLARACASVVLADVDRSAAEETLSIIRSEMPGASVLVAGCDVTSEKDVAKAYKGVLDRWGGLDVLVNAAGIAPAFPLVDFPADKWRLALEINITGYFLMAREAARIMTRQGMGGSIVNISSKSGLDASVNNSAYNATKSAELHLARGWALELGKNGIRVNSVAPGNVFEGSKIWNPKYIEEAAKKYGIKPSEVIPYYVNKTALKREIVGQDIADAVVFLCSDKARTITGQTLVADSGQVMVR